MQDDDQYWPRKTHTRTWPNMQDQDWKLDFIKVVSSQKKFNNFCTNFTYLASVELNTKSIIYVYIMYGYEYNVRLRRQLNISC